jgi:flagellar biogenesis protein FliO
MKPFVIYFLFATLALLTGVAKAQYQNPASNFQVRGQGGQNEQPTSQAGQGMTGDKWPTIERMHQREVNALPPLPHNAPPVNEPSNAKWLGNQRLNPTAGHSAAPAVSPSQIATANSQVVPASVIHPNVENNASSRLKLNPPTEKRSSGEGGSSTLQMLLSVGSSLLIVLGLFLGFAWFYRKTLNNSFSGLPKSVVKVLGRTNLAPRQQLMVVRFGSKLVLVSLVQGEARTLSEITDPMEVDQLVGLCESHQPNITTSFRSILHQTDRGVA